MSEPYREDGLYPMRLQRFLARAGAASRRGAERLMSEGRVRVNGQVVSELGSKVDPARDEVTLDGRPVVLADAPFCCILYKPAGYLTTMADPQGRPTVASLVPVAEHPGLFPVGRLDQDTTGLLLFTTDGDLGQALLHPRYHVDKTYVALVEGVPAKRELDRLRRGVMLEDGPAAPAEARLLAPDDPLCRVVAPDGPGATGAGEPNAVAALTIHEGRKHQVKKMFAAIGHKVLRLHRQSFGPITLTGVCMGSWRTLEAEEERALAELAARGAQAQTAKEAASR